MKNKSLPFQITFSLGMIMVLSACSLFSSGSIEEQTPVPETAATTPPPVAEEPVDSVDSAVEGPLVPNPASIDISLEADAAAAAMIGPEGGSIETMDANGTEYTLTIPEGALFSEVEITMTPIASAEGESIGDTFIAGVALEPENLHFLELVSIEVSGAGIEAGVIGFSSGRGGQDFHLTPSKFTSGSINITTTHFSEFGVSQQDVHDLAEMILPIAEIAQIEHALAIGSDAQALAALERMIESLRNTSQIENFEAWEPWTANVMSLIQRIGEVISDRSWDLEDTPGLSDTLNKMQGLIDQWYQQSDGVMQDLAEKCVQGEIEVEPRMRLIRHVGRWLDDRLSLDRDEILENWKEMRRTCFEWELTWQASVVTTGSDFFSDISLGSQVHFSQGITFGEETTLEVEYIDGFFEGICVATPGIVELGLEVLWRGSSEHYSADLFISSITAYVSIIDQVYIDCSPAGFEITADAQKPFHGGALELLNEDRLDRRGRWEYDLEYDPGGGIIAQFEEGPESFSWSEGKYDLWQLLTLYQATPAN